MKLRLLACLCLLGCIRLSGLAAESSSLAGRWKLDKDRSSSLERWAGEELVIKIDTPVVKIDRTLILGESRHVSDTTSLKTDNRTATIIPVAYWFDTWYNNTYIGGDHKKTVRGAWLENGRILKVETSLLLDAQQGDIPVHIYDEYRLSADGRTLRLFELRSTRDQPLTYVFTRE